MVLAKTSRKAAKRSRRRLTSNAESLFTERVGRAAGQGQRGYRCDHPQAVPEIDQAFRLRPESVRRMALSRPRRARQGQQPSPAESGLRAEPAALSGRADPAGAGELRLRLRARG